MTGQGNIQFQQIKKAHQAGRLHCLNLSKTYTTTQGHRVRALVFSTSDKCVKDGKIMHILPRQIIRGQVYLRNPVHFEWTDQAWEVDGRHMIHEYHNLVEVPSAPVRQTEMFQSI